MALLVALLTAAGTMLPLSPGSIREGFYPMLHFGAATGRLVGSQLISTFGPLGFVFDPIYFPATYAWLFALRAALAAVTCWTVAWIGYSAWEGPLGAALAVGACAPFLAVDDVWFLVLPLLTVLMELPGRSASRWLRLALGAGIGLASLIKFTFLMAAVAVLTPVTVRALLARRMPVVPAAAVIGAALAWVATGHSWCDWLAYLDWSREISAGYSSAMQLPFDRDLAWHVAGVSAAVLAGGALLAWQRLRWASWPVVLALAADLFLLFKAGFVRADVHMYITCFGLLVISWLLALLWGKRSGRLLATVLAAGLPVGIWIHTAAVIGPPRMFFPPIFPRQALQRLVDGVTALRDGALLTAYAHTVQAIRNTIPLPPLPGGVDVYPGDHGLLLAYNADLRPRPVFQSFMAYTPRLAHANVDALLDDDAPAWILFRIAPIDGELPALDEAPSWPILLTRYRLAETRSPFALLQRRATPVPWRLEPIGSVATQTDAEIAVPSVAAGLIWATISIAETRRDVVMRTLLAAPQVFLAVSYRDGQRQKWRVVPALARDGFLLSPVIETTAGFIQLEQFGSQPIPSLKSREVAALRVLGFTAAPRAVDVQFFRLIIDSRGADEGPPP